MQREFGVNAGPGEVLSEAFQGLRNRSARGEMSVEEAQRLSDEYREQVYTAYSMAPDYLGIRARLRLML